MVYSGLFLIAERLSFHQARLDQCKVTMGTLEKQLEEEKQRVQAAESHRGAGTGTHQTHNQICEGNLSFIRRSLCCCRGLRSAEAGVAQLATHCRV